MRRESSSQHLTVVVPPATTTATGLSISVEDVDDPPMLLRVQHFKSEENQPGGGGGSDGGSTPGSGHADAAASEPRATGGGMGTVGSSSGGFGSLRARPAVGAGRTASIRSPLRSPLPKRGGLPGFDSWNTATTTVARSNADDGGGQERGRGAWSEDRDEHGNPMDRASTPPQTETGSDAVQDAVVAMHAASPLVAPRRRRVSTTTTSTATSSDGCGEATAAVVPPGSPQYGTLWDDKGCGSPMVSTPAAAASTTQQQRVGSRRSFPSRENSLPSTPTLPPPGGGGGSTVQPAPSLNPLDATRRSSNKASPQFEHVRSPLLDVVRSPKSGGASTGRHRLPSPRAFMDLDPAHRFSVILPKAMAAAGGNSSAAATAGTASPHGGSNASGGVAEAEYGAALAATTCAAHTATVRPRRGSGDAEGGGGQTPAPPPPPLQRCSQPTSPQSRQLSPTIASGGGGMLDSLEKQRNASDDCDNAVLQQQDAMEDDDLQDPMECLQNATTHRGGASAESVQQQILRCLPLCLTLLVVAGLVLLLVIVGAQVDDLGQPESARVATQSGLAYVAQRMQTFQYDATILANRLVHLYAAAGITADGRFTAAAVPPATATWNVNGSLNLWDASAAAANGTAPTTSVALDVCAPLGNGVVAVGAYNASGHRLHMLRCEDRVYGIYHGALSSEPQTLFRVLDDDALPARVAIEDVAVVGGGTTTTTTAAAVGMHWLPSTARNVVLSSGTVDAGGVPIIVRVVVVPSVARLHLFGQNSVAPPVTAALFASTPSSNSGGGVALVLLQNAAGSSSSQASAAAALEATLMSQCGGGTALTSTWTRAYLNSSSIAGSISRRSPLDVVNPVYAYAAAASASSMCASFCHAIAGNASFADATDDAQAQPLGAIGCPNVVANLNSTASTLTANGVGVAVVFPARTAVYLVVTAEGVVSDRGTDAVLQALQAFVIPLMVLVVVSQVLLYASAAVPAMLLTRRMHATVSGQRWRLHAHERWLASWTKPLWTGDMHALMRSYQLLAACFALNQTYVPDYILEQQMRKLADPLVLANILAEGEPWDDAGGGAGADDASLAGGDGGDGALMMGEGDDMDAMEGEEERLVESLGATLNPLLPHSAPNGGGVEPQQQHWGMLGSLPQTETIADSFHRNSSPGLGGSAGRGPTEFIPPYYASHRLPSGASSQQQRPLASNPPETLVTAAPGDDGSEGPEKASHSTSTTSSRRSHRFDGGTSAGISGGGGPSGVGGPGASGTLLRPTAGYFDHSHNSVPANRRVSLFAVQPTTVLPPHHHAKRRSLGASGGEAMATVAPEVGGAGSNSSSRMVVDSSTNLITVAPLPHHHSSSGVPPLATKHQRTGTPQAAASSSLATQLPASSTPTTTTAQPQPHHHYPSGGMNASATTTTLGRVLLSQNMVLQDNATIVVVTLRAVEEAYRADFFVTEQQHRKILMTINSVIRRHKGEVFERTGERVSVAWNAFEARADHAVRAVRCATDIAALFRQFRRDGLRMGIVVHQGPVVCGIVGDHREAASVLFGQTAEHAVRLAVLAAQLPYFNVLVSEPVKKAVSIFFECVIVDVVRDREIDAPLALFDVRQELNAARGTTATPGGQRGQPTNSDFVVGCATAFALFRAHQFRDAQAQLQALQSTASYADDMLVGRLSALCAYYDAHREELPRPYCRWLPRWDIFEYPADPLCAAFNGYETADGTNCGDVPSTRFANYLVTHMKAVAGGANPTAAPPSAPAAGGLYEGSEVGSSRKISNATTTSSSASFDRHRYHHSIAPSSLSAGGAERSASIAVFQEKLARVHSGGGLGAARKIANAGPTASTTTQADAATTVQRATNDDAPLGVCEMPQFEEVTATSLHASGSNHRHTASGRSQTTDDDGGARTGTHTSPPTSEPTPKTTTTVASQQRRPNEGNAASSTPSQSAPPVTQTTQALQPLVAQHQPLAGSTASAVFKCSLVESMTWSTTHSLVGGAAQPASLFQPAQQQQQGASSLPSHGASPVPTGSGRVPARNPSFSALQQSSLVGIPSQNMSRSSQEESGKVLRPLPTRIESAHGSTYVRSSRILGTGSFGCVYLGMEQHTGRLVAMKFLPLPSDEAEVRVLQNEVVTMETVTDANLVEFYGYAFVDNMIVLMMECLVAGSLAGMLTTFAALPEQTTINFVRDVLRGLHRLHSMGIVHRDVKPQNVLIAANGHCKISDFGASASIHELVRRHDGGAEVQGTPIYLAPEAARGHAEPKSDVWSVGIMYLQLTTGSIPYDAGAMGAGIGAVVFGIGSGRLRPTIPEDLSPLARAFVEGCLADDAKQRRTAEQLLELPFFCVF